LIALLTWTNTRGLEYGRIIQNIFTTTKSGALAALILLGIVVGRNSAAVSDNFGALWSVRSAAPIGPGLSAVTAFGLFVAICVSQAGSLFSADAWNNITFTAGEVKDPRRNIPLSLALGTIVVISLYLLANVAYSRCLRSRSARARRPRGNGDAQRHFSWRGHDDHGRRDHDLDLWLQ
jgi:APA family basic amino acid/polyamine antiporter